MKKIVLTGGGTAGHVMPNLALLPELKKHFSTIVYIGTNGIEKELAQKHGLKFYEITATKLVRRKFFKNLALPFKFACSIKKAKKQLKEIKPNVIFSKGGFVALPVVIAAKKLSIPVVSHESDLSFGLANKIILHYANKVVTSFELTARDCKKCAPLGSPLRQEIFKGDKEKAFKECGFEKRQKTILFFGGSLGAKAINSTVEKSLPLLVAKFNIIHITGKNQKINFENRAYFQTEFTNEIENFFALADIVVCRAGANSLFELLAIKKPMILIPLPKGSLRGDQIENAKYFEEKGWAKVIYQESLTKQNLLKTLETLNTKNLVQAMEKVAGKNTNRDIVALITSLAK